MTTFTTTLYTNKNGTIQTTIPIHITRQYNIKAGEQIWIKIKKTKFPITTRQSGISTILTIPKIITQLLQLQKHQTINLTIYPTMPTSSSSQSDTPFT